MALLVGALSLGLRVAWVAWVRVVPVSDFATYDFLGWTWATTGRFGMSAYRTPGYPGFLALVYTACGHSWRAAGLAQAGLGALTSALVVLLAARAVSPRASAVAGLLHALSPTAIVYTPVLASENLAAPLLVVALLLVAVADERPRRGRQLAAAGSGVVLGLLLLTRPAGVFFGPGWLALFAYSPTRREWRLHTPLVAAAAVLLVLLPWLVRNHCLGHGFTTLSTTGGYNLWIANNSVTRTGGEIVHVAPPGTVAGLRGRARDDAYRHAAMAWIRSHPDRYLALVRTRAARLLGGEGDAWAARFLTPLPDGGHGGRVHRRNVILLSAVRAVMAPLVLLALALGLARGRAFALPVLPALSYLAGLALTFAKPRMRELSDPLLFIPLAALLCDLLFRTHELGRWPSRRVKLALALGLVAASVVVHATGYALRWYRLPPMA